MYTHGKQMCLRPCLTKVLTHAHSHTLHSFAADLKRELITKYKNGVKLEQNHAGEEKILPVARYGNAYNPTLPPRARPVPRVRYRRVFVPHRMPECECRELLACSCVCAHVADMLPRRRDLSHTVALEQTNKQLAAHMPAAQCAAVQSGALVPRGPPIDELFITKSSVGATGSTQHPCAFAQESLVSPRSL